MTKQDLKQKDIYWADQVASRLIKKGKKKYVITSGTSPSGIIHFGKLREVITTDFVYRALKRKGVDVEFIHSYDDFDRFRKVPAGIPETYKEHIGKPLTDVPDPLGCHKNYAEHYESLFMKELELIGISPKPIFQSKEYRLCRYKDGIKLALQNRDKIIKILDKYKTSSVPEDWWPVVVYCSKCGKDSTKILEYDGKYTIKYSCKCGNEEKVDFSKKGLVKLVWRVDWPMRWWYYKIDFEPGGKDHFSAGSSYDTGKEIVKEVYNYTPPDYVIYNQVKLKGQGVKMSSSLGNVVTISDLLNIYYPEILRFLYAGVKPNKEFDLPLGEDVIKTYEDFYKVERIYFGEEKLGNKKKEEHWRRVYEMSMPFELPKRLPIQPSFRKAVNLSQIYRNDKDVIANFGLEIRDDWDKYRIETIIRNARNWVNKYAPERYKFELKEEKHFEPTKEEQKAIKLMLIQIEDNVISTEELYEVAKLSGMGKDFFKLMYKILLGKDYGPKLINLIEMIGIDKFRAILKEYV